MCATRSQTRERNHRARSGIETGLRPRLAEEMDASFAAGDPPVGVSASMHAAARAWAPAMASALQPRLDSLHSLGGAAPERGPASSSPGDETRCPARRHGYVAPCAMHRVLRFERRDPLLWLASGPRCRSAMVSSKPKRVPSTTETDIPDLG